MSGGINSQETGDLQTLLVLQSLPESWHGDDQYPLKLKVNCQLQGLEAHFFTFCSSHAPRAVQQISNLNELKISSLGTTKSKLITKGTSLPTSLPLCLSSTFCDDLRTTGKPNQTHSLVFITYVYNVSNLFVANIQFLSLYEFSSCKMICDMCLDVYSLYVCKIQTISKLIL